MDRLKESLHSFFLDNRSILELHNFVLQFASMLEVEGSQGIGNWQEYLLNDVSFRLAYLLSVDSNYVKQDVDEQLIFIKETYKFIGIQAEKDQADSLLKKIHGDLEALIYRYLSQEITVKNLEDFYRQFKINLLGAYQDSLAGKSDHTPDIGLLFTFIQLYHKYLLPDINKLPSKLTEFYYETVINKKRSPALPDAAYVYFEPAKFVKQSIVEKGVALYAGKDINNKGIIFETLDDVQLSQSELVDIRTLYFTGAQGDGTQGIFIRQCFSGENYEDFETFGKNVALYREPELEEIAEFGFAIASKLLYLKEGERLVVLRLPKPNSDTDLSDWEKFFADLFYYEITTEDGWASIESLEVISTEYGIEIELRFSKDFAPIEAFQEFSHLPAVSCLIKREGLANRVEIFNKLKDFRINPKSIGIEVEVSGIQDLSCYNDLGVLNINQPFQPFGAIPKKYSKFIIGNAEAFQKPLEEITLTIDWNLPNWDFETYFKAYSSIQPDISNLDAYKVKFNTSKRQNEEYLFDRVDDEMSSSSITTAVGTQQYFPADWSPELPTYSKDAKWGYLEMQLISPGHPFGVGLYQQIIASQIGKSNTENAGLINPPMIPEMRGIQLSYRSKITSDQIAGTSQFYHIHPFGKELVDVERCGLGTQKYEDQETGKNYRGALFLGVRALTAGILSIYFELAGSSLIPSSSETSVISPSFFIVCDNQLQPLSIVSDTTEGFEQSGIIQLNIESSFVSQQSDTILPPHLDWIMIAVQGNVESFGLTNRINLHGTAVIRTSSITKQGGIGGGALERGSIFRTLEDIPAIKKVIQPSSSFSGKTEEEARSFTKRVAAEVRHRYRPSKAQDLEAIIRDKFPQVHLCRVFCENNQLSVVVVPFRQSNTLRPAFAVSFLVKVKSFVQELVSPFLKVTVENPHYAILQTNSYLSVKSRSLKLMKDQLKFKVKQELIRQHLNPWIADSEVIGKTPNFTYLKRHLETSFEQIQVDGFVFYYYYYSPENISYAHYFFSNRQNDIRSKKVIFLPDENINFHKVDFGGLEEFQKETNRTDTITPLGFYYPPTNESI